MNDTGWMSVLSRTPVRVTRRAKQGSAFAEEQCDAPLQSLLCDDASHCFSSMDFSGPVVGKPRDRLSEKSDPNPSVRSRKAHPLSYNA